MIVTRRARTLLLLAFVCAAIGLVEYYSFLVQLGVATILWIGAEWCVFQWRANTWTRRVQAQRQIADRTGPSRVLWNGRPVRVQVQMDIRASLRWLPASWVTIEDLLPHGVRCQENNSARGAIAVRVAQRQTIEYGLQAESVGAVRVFRVAMHPRRPARVLCRRAIYPIATIVARLATNPKARHGGDHP